MEESPSELKETLEEREARLNATVWKDEIQAQRYGQTLVKLNNAIRSAANKLSALARFEFKTIKAPAPEGKPELLELGIRRQHFDDSHPMVLPYEQWRQTLLNLHQSGWRLEHVEWYHEKFNPPGKSGAWSEYSFRLHGHRQEGRTRFIVQGRLGIDWDPASASLPAAKAAQLTVSDLIVLERTGKPGFTAHANVTPEPPKQRGEMINMHPLIVTDLNGDGHEDVVMAGVNRLFLNDGAANFTSLEFIAEPVFRGSSDAGVVADFDGDAVLDFLTVGRRGSLTNRVLLYPGGSVPLNAEPLPAWPEGRVQAPSVATAGDIDLDGDLDVWIAQYKPPYVGGQLPSPYYDANDGYPSYLLINDGNGRFQQETVSRGLGGKRHRRTLAASFADLDGDHDLDLITVNDYAGVDLFYNDGSGFFSDQTHRLYNRHLFGMGHCLADFDLDSDLDLYAIGMSVPVVRRLEYMKAGLDHRPDHTRMRVDMAYGNRLYLREGDRWIKPGFAGTLADTLWSWGTTAFDFDNDGRSDIYVANGHISGESVENYASHTWTHDIYLGSSHEDPKLLIYFARPFRGVNTGKTSSDGYQHNVLFKDLGENDYINIAYLMGVAHEADCRAVVSADLNNDGKMDLVLTDAEWFGGPHRGRNRLRIHLNQLDSPGHWIGVKLKSSTPGVSPIGSKVWLNADGRKIPAHIITGDSYQSQHPFTVHFGLDQTRQVDKLQVRWPDGAVQELVQPRVDTYHTVRYESVFKNDR